MKLGILVSLILAAPASFADVFVCAKERPNWSDIGDGRQVAESRGPAVIINLPAKRVTWIGTGGYIRLHGEHNSRGVKITRIDGRAAQEKITSQKTRGRVTDLELEDSLGGMGLMRIYMDGGEGRANWQHATDEMREDLSYCTTNVIQ